MTAAERQRLKEIGKDAFIREEMVRLGFWPPSPEVAEQSAEAERKLRPLYEELVGVRRELDGVEKKIRESGDVPALLAEIRRKRIERVRSARVVKKVEREAARVKKTEQDALWRRTALPHLGRGVSAGLSFADGELEAFSKAIGLSERELAWLCYQRPASKTGHYSLFTIPKKRGGRRVLASPKTKLRQAQRWVAGEILAKQTPHSAATAFSPGASVVKNAEPHTGKAVVVKLDLQDFFPSLGVKRVKNYFVGIGQSEGIATILALLCTDCPRVVVEFDGERKFVAVGPRGVPQGALTSPALSNLLVRKLDARLLGAAQKLGFVYTRYADDLTFSHAEESAPVGLLLTLVRQIVADEKLIVNEKKTQVLRTSDRQIITGLVVNGEQGVRLSRDDMRKFRAILHHCDTDGFEKVSERLGRSAQAYCQGYLSFIKMVRPELAEKFVVAHSWLA
ncbi:reverse transcriptase domain-containing protein [Armatimonas sp.]|uniref:reverse transcriptase domain-containing protein n=1 Tax=Armatimonas sp. TaxID=1872638 RepID=UPI003751CC0B